MSRLRIYKDDNATTPQFESESHDNIGAKLRAVGVRFEYWHATAEILAGAEPETVLAAYDHDIKGLIEENGYQTVDVISLSSNHPDKVTLRNKFLSEHRHTEDEVRFFVAGEGLFSLHIDQQVYEVLCQQGDLISVPANTAHWFDMGPNPNFVAIRLFNNPEGWVAHYTDSDIASHFSRLEN